MSDGITFDQFGRSLRVAMCDTFREQITGGHLSQAGLFRIRDRLTGGEFGPGTDRELLLLGVIAAIATWRGIDPSEVAWGGADRAGRSERAGLGPTAR